MEATNSGNLYQQLTTTILKVAKHHFDEKDTQRKKFHLTTQTERLLAQRATAREQLDWDEASRIDKIFRRSLKEDKTAHILSTFEKSLDLRCRWMGLKILRKGYSPAPYYRRNATKAHIPLDNRAEQSAAYY